MLMKAKNKAFSFSSAKLPSIGMKNIKKPNIYMYLFQNSGGWETIKKEIGSINRFWASEMKLKLCEINFHSRTELTSTTQMQKLDDLDSVKWFYFTRSRYCLEFSRLYGVVWIEVSVKLFAVQYSGIFWPSFSAFSSLFWETKLGIR